MAGLAPCPLCGSEIYVPDRYPTLICRTCGDRAVDERGRPMRFGTTTVHGTDFVAEVEEAGVWRRIDGDRVTCFVDERECVAGEDYSGGHFVALSR
jgi:hypothetical protein